MTLQQLSLEYGAGAQAIKDRIRELKTRAEEEKNESARLALNSRIRLLSSMWRDMRDIAVLTQHYYERGYCRNAKYIL